jgi:hypothetical protein
MNTPGTDATTDSASTITLQRATSASPPLYAEEEDNRLLPSTFSPSSKHVICARGKSYWDHEGNKKYRQLIAAATKKYQEATNKGEKSSVVSDIVESIHRQGGGFVKKSPTGTGFVQISEQYMRERISQSLRDSLHSQYRSSTKAKNSRRSKVTEKINVDVSNAITSNAGVMLRLQRLTSDLERKEALTSDVSICSLFSQANLDILELIKSDGSLLSQFQVATSSAAINEDAP